MHESQVQALRERTSDDLCTPKIVLDAVERVGSIGLDPCSNEWSIVPARKALSIDRGEDGLETPWVSLVARGELVFVNPPYSGGLDRWARKIMFEVARGCEVVALVRGDWSTRWWRQMLARADAVAYWFGRIRFLGGGYSAGTFASALIYYGPRRMAFRRALEPHADVRLMPRRRWG